MVPVSRWRSAVVAALAAALLVVLIVPLSQAQAATGNRSISGKISGPAGVDLTELTVRLVSAGPFRASAENFEREISLDLSGSYTFNSLEPGRYKLQVEVLDREGPNVVPQWFGGALTREAATPIDITSDSASGIDLDMAAGATLTATVTGASAEFRGLFVGTPQGDVVATGLRQGQSDHFVVERIPAGTFSLTLSGAEQFAETAAQFKAQALRHPDGGGTWTFSEGAQVETAVAARTTDARLGGRVDTYGFSSYDVESPQDTMYGTIKIYEQIGDDLVYVDDASQGAYFGVYGSAPVNFESPKLPAGRYTVLFDDPRYIYEVDPREVDGPIATQWYRAKDSASEADFVDLAAGQTVRGVDGTLHPVSWSRPASGFVDATDKTTAFGDEIAWMKAEGISTGYPLIDGEAYYMPRRTVSREAMAAFLYRAAGSPEFQAPTTSPFIDVTSETTGFTKEIAWLDAQGISTGWSTPSGREFRPKQSITREAMAAFLHRWADYPRADDPSPFIDVDELNPFGGSIAWLAESGISTGWSTSKGPEFRPKAPITREAMAAFLKRFADLQD